MNIISAQPSRIAGVVSSVPSNIVDNMALAHELGLQSPARLIDAIGVRKRRLAHASIKFSDLAHHAAEYLLDQLSWEANSIDGVIVITQSPDRGIPATACRLHNKLNLKSECFAFDVNLGCSAYPYGLWLAQQLMNVETVKRVLLVVGDLATRNTDPNNPGVSFLFGDAATATALETDKLHENMFREDFVILGTDGSGDHAIELGQYKRFEHDTMDGIPLYLAPMIKMDGQAVASFAIDTVPRMIRAIEEARKNQAHDWTAHNFYLLHQANGQLVKHIALKAGLSSEQLPVNLDRYGNTASASIPLLITTELAPVLKNRSLALAMFGFGTGLSWSAISKTVGPLDVVATIDYPASLYE